MDHIERHNLPATLDLVVLSHLRWDFVYQRPQHLLSRCARVRRVFFCEEPVVHDDREFAARLDVSPREPNVWVCAPQLPAGLSHTEAERLQRELLDRLLVEQQLNHFVAWYYSPMPLGFTRHLRPAAIIYDCMDELSGFVGASPLLREREQELFTRADLVFTGGQSLWEAKRMQHASVHAFPSSIDAPHFESARGAGESGAALPEAEPTDQADIPSPRLGYFGVIDERMDLELIAGIADARPDWHIVMVGPVVKIDPARLPRRANIHYLGGKAYQDLPAYIAGWDVALMPFAHNDSTRFISPTKTPEYLAAGKPVVSTSIRDVVRPYGDLGLVAIADSVDEFVAAIAGELGRGDRARWLAEVDAFLAGNSWDTTWERMQRLIAAVIRGPGVRAGSARATASV
ncbi:MAG: glycosyltransferase family 1 protein [Nannocystis sp.]|nr:glycosyltransferase family 1 protein [Nannocystis sp.]MBA3548651.1 glycosyltransferase family 1 protein [Nannocystis sp.]